MFGGVSSSNESEITGAGQEASSYLWGWVRGDRETINENCVFSNWTESAGELLDSYWLGIQQHHYFCWIHICRFE